VRSIGSDLKMDYTAVGQTTHLAARMEQMATPGSILITVETLRLAEGYVEVKSLGPVNVKGLSEPVEVYEVAGAGPVRSRMEAAAARGLSRFVGRDAEMHGLQQALEQAGAGHGQIVAVVGEPGVGKSRLFYEFTRSHRTEGWLLLESSSASYGKATPYLPVIDLIKSYCQIEARDDGRKIREKLTGKLLTLDRVLEPTLPAFLALLDVPVDDPQWHALDPPQRRQRTFDAVKRLLLRESQAQPLLLVFEDLHWIDSETQVLLDNLIESLPTARIFLLVNYRPEYQHGWGNKTYYTQLRIDPLPPESAEELLHDLLGDEIGLQPFKRGLVERTEGNPFFLEEIVRTLVETKVLTGARGAYRLTKALEEIQVPATVQAVLAARIDRLPPDEKRLLQSAAVIGEVVPFTLLRAVVETSEEELRRSLTHVQAAEFLYEASLFPELEYTFKHGLTYQVAYNSLLHERRTFLHARIVNALEEMTGSTSHDQLDKLANHAYHGELWNKAVTYSRNAATKAMSNSAFLTGLSSYERAFQALKHVPESREKLEQQIDLHLDSRNALFLLGDLSRIAEHLHAAESIAQTLGDRHRVVRVLDFLNGYYGLAGEPERAIEFGRRALDLTSASENPASSAVTHYYLGVAYKQTGQYSVAIDVLKRGIQNIDDSLRHERFGTAIVLSVTCRSHLVQSLTATGQFSEGVLRGQEGVRIAEEANHPASLVHVNCSLGVLFLSKGELDKAISVLERSLKICHSANIPVYVSLVASRLGSAYANSGRVAEAMPYLEQGAETYASAGRLAFLSLSIAWLSEGYLLSGRVEEARAAAERAFELSRKHKERGHEAWTLQLLGDIAAHQNPPDAGEVVGHYRQALALAEELGMRPLIAHCHVGLGKLYRRIGSRQQAEEHLTTGTAMMREMEMGLWLEKAETELNKLVKKE
jgi:tetratricopeptide (TPR) repeat protein